MLGPITFSQAVNNLPESCPGTDLQAYADDTGIYTNRKTAAAAAGDQLSEHFEAITAGLKTQCKKQNNVCMLFTLRMTLID